MATVTVDKEKEVGALAFAFPLKVFLSTILVFTVFAAYAVSQRTSIYNNEHRLSRVEVTTVWCIAILLWIATMHFVLKKQPQIVLGFLVPIFIAIVEMIGTAITPSSLHQHERSASQMDTNSLVSIGFALASAAVISRAPTLKSKKNTSPDSSDVDVLDGGDNDNVIARRMIAISLIICLAVLLPSVSRMNQRRITLMQRIATSFSIGLLACSASLHFAKL